MTYRFFICLYMLEASLVVSKLFGEQYANKINFLFLKSCASLDTPLDLCYNKRKKGGAK